MTVRFISHEDKHDVDTDNDCYLVVHVRSKYLLDLDKSESTSVEREHRYIPCKLYLQGLPDGGATRWEVGAKIDMEGVFLQGPTLSNGQLLFPQVSVLFPEKSYTKEGMQDCENDSTVASTQVDQSSQERLVSIF